MAKKVVATVRPPTAYEKGRRLEYDLKRQLERQGYWVIRSAGSHSPADLVVVYDGGVCFVQVQKDGYLNKEKANRLRMMARKAKQIAVFAYKGKEGWRFVSIHPEEEKIVASLDEIIRRGQKGCF